MTIAIVSIPANPTMVTTPMRDLVESRASMPRSGRPVVGDVGTTDGDDMELPTFVIEARHRLIDLDLGAIWQRRELLYFLVWRAIKGHREQTAVGAARARPRPLPRAA